MCALVSFIAFVFALRVMFSVQACMGCRHMLRLEASAMTELQVCSVPINARHAMPASILVGVSVCCLQLKPAAQLQRVQISTWRLLCMHILPALMVAPHCVSPMITFALPSGHHAKP